MDRRRLVTDPQIRQEVSTTVRRHLSANPPEDSSVDDVKAALTAAIMRTADLVILPQERRSQGARVCRRTIGRKVDVSMKKVNRLFRGPEAQGICEMVWMGRAVYLLLYIVSVHTLSLLASSRLVHDRTTEDNYIH